jgi:hypothetical protein
MPSVIIVTTQERKVGKDGAQAGERAEDTLLERHDSRMIQYRAFRGVIQVQVEHRS